MADIQDGQQYVKVEAWPKFEAGCQFLVPVFVFNCRAMTSIFVIFGNDWHPKLTNHYVADQQSSLHTNWNFEFSIIWSL